MLKFTSLFVLALYIVGCFGLCDLSGGYIYSAVTGHYYSVLQCWNETWDGANTYAQNLSHPVSGQGYLMTIEDYAEQDMIFSRNLPHPGFVDVFLGGVDSTGTNTWYWTGPDSATNFYNTNRGCTSYCNFDICYPPAAPTAAQGLRLRGTKWVATPTAEEDAWVWAFVEYGCCDCGDRGVCNETTCQCTCEDDYVGDHCETYIGSCAQPGAPICNPVTPVCIKPTAAPTESA